MTPAQPLPPPSGLKHTDLLAARLATQLGWIEAEVAQEELFGLDANPRPARDFVQRLVDRGLLTPAQVDVLRRRVVLFEHVWLEHFYLEELEQKCPVEKGLVARLIAALEEGSYRRRLGDELIAAGKLSEAQDRRLLFAAVRRMQDACGVALADARAELFAAAARPLVPDPEAGRPSFSMAELFRSQRTQGLVRRARTRSLRRPPAAPEPPSAQP